MNTKDGRAGFLNVNTCCSNSSPDVGSMSLGFASNMVVATHLKGE